MTRPRCKISCRLTLCAIIALTCTFLAFTNSARADNAITFNNQVRTLFAEQCLGCHNADKKRGDLDLSTYAGMSAGSSSGKVFVPGDPDNSTLLQVIAHTKEPFMPPRKPK